MKKFLVITTSLVLLAACSTIPPEAYINRGDPETLLDVSSEVVNLDIGSPDMLAQFAGWVEEDAPSRAELYCPAQDPLCEEAQSIMKLNNVPYQQVPSSEFSAALVYERILARDCENRFIDQSINPYHLNHPSFGCSVTSNMVQHVSDKSQFVRPGLLDNANAAKAVQVYENYMQPPLIPEANSVEDALTSSVE